MKAFRSIPRAACRSHWRLVLPGIPSEGTLLQIPSSGSNLEFESWPSGGCRSNCRKLGPALIKAESLIQSPYLKRQPMGPNQFRRLVSGP